MEESFNNPRGVIYASNQAVVNISGIKHTAVPKKKLIFSLSPLLLGVCVLVVIIRLLI